MSRYREEAQRFAVPVPDTWGDQRPNHPSLVATGQVYALLALAESIDNLAQAVRELGPQQQIEIVETS